MASGRGTVGNLLVNMRIELGQLRTDVKEIEKTFNTGFASIKSSAASFGRDLASSLGVGLSVGAVVGFAKQVIDLGSRLKDLQVQTGISAQTLSGLKSVLEENGTSLEAFATGIFRLQKELGTIKNESDPTAQAIKQLGLNLDQLRNADTDKFLTLVSDALAKQENPITRAALAYQFMGRQARELVPALLEMAGKIDEFKSKGLTEADVKILDDFADSWTRASNAVKLFVATDIAGVIREFSKDLEFLNGLMADFGNFDFTQSLTSFTKGLQNTQKEVLQFYESMLKIIRAAPLFFEWLSFGKLNFNSKMWTDMIKSIEDLKNEIGQPSSHEEVPAAGPRFKPPIDEAALKKARDELARVAESIDQENEKLEAQIIEFKQGKDAADDFLLTQKELRETSKGMTADIQHEQDRRRALTADVREFIKALEEQKKWTEEIQAVSKAWAASIDETADAEQKFADLKIDLEQYDTLSRTLTDISKKYMKLITDAEEWGRVAGATPGEIETVTRRLLINRALEQVRARVGEEPSADDEGRRRAQQLGEDIGGSITSGIRNTLMGIETGQQSVSEGLKNMLRNIGLELQFLLFDESVLKPIKAFAKGFVTGLFDSISGQFEKDMGDLGERLGKALKELLDSLMSSDSGVGQWISKGIGMIGSLFGMGAGATAETGGLIQAFAKGGPVLSFASGGAVPILAHSGEFVMNRRAVSNVGASVMSRINDSGRLPQGDTIVNINGSIIPNDPNARRDEIIQVMVADADNNGAHFRTLHSRSSVLSKG